MMLVSVPSSQLGLKTSRMRQTVAVNTHTLLAETHIALSQVLW